MTANLAGNTKGIAIIVVAAVVTVFAIITVGLRVWARRLKCIRLDASDWTCILGLVGLLLPIRRVRR
jgi:type II secretory pathway component PulK